MLRCIQTLSGMIQHLKHFDGSKESDPLTINISEMIAEQLDSLGDNEQASMAKIVVNNSGPTDDFIKSRISPFLKVSRDIRLNYQARSDKQTTTKPALVYKHEYPDGDKEATTDQLHLAHKKRTNMFMDHLTSLASTKDQKVQVHLICTHGGVVATEAFYFLKDYARDVVGDQDPYKGTGIMILDYVAMNIHA